MYMCSAIMDMGPGPRPKADADTDTGTAAIHDTYKAQSQLVRVLCWDIFLSDLLYWVGFELILSSWTQLEFCDLDMVMTSDLFCEDVG